MNGATHEVQGRLVFRMNIFDGGIKDAEVQENMRRESEAVLALSQVHREVEEAVRTSWNRMRRQGELAAAYQQQLNASASLVGSYEEQFGVGQRSLLDVLDAQNTRYNVQVLAETAQFVFALPDTGCSPHQASCSSSWASALPGRRTVTLARFSARPPTRKPSPVS